jgi:hypothetical protein
MAIHSTHLETLQPVIATALHIVKNRTLAGKPDSSTELHCVSSG